MSKPKTVHVLTIDTDHVCQEHDIVPELETLQRMVGGDIEGLTLVEPQAVLDKPGGDIVGRAAGLRMYFQEEGKIHGREDNLLANLIVNHCGVRLQPGDRIVGPVLLFGGYDDDGNMLDLNDVTIDWLRANQLSVFDA